MAEAVGDKWVYLLSQQEAEQDVTAMAVVEDEDNKPSKNPDDDGETTTADKIDGRLIDGRLIKEALRTYRAACKRAAKILGDGTGAPSSSNAGGGRGPRAVMDKENSRYDDPYNDGDTNSGNEPDPYYPGYGSSSALVSLGSCYDYNYYNRHGYGYEYYEGYYGYGYGYSYDYNYPGAAYGYAESYAPYLQPGYQTTAVYLAPPPPAMNATTSFYSPPAPWAMPYVNMAPASYVPPWLQQLRDSTRADEPSLQAVAPTTTQPPEPSCSWD